MEAMIGLYVQDWNESENRVIVARGAALHGFQGRKEKRCCCTGRLNPGRNSTP